MFRALTSPRMIGLHLLAVAATTAAVFLGLWQYDAWHTRRDNQALDRATAAPMHLAEVISSDAPFPGNAIGQPVEFTGEWLPDDTIFVADRSLHGRSGYWVVTPVAVCAEPSVADCAQRPAMLVVRGWTRVTQDAPPAPRGRVEVTGWLQPPEGSGIPDPDPNDDVLQEMRIADAIQHVDQDLYGAYVIARKVSTGSTTGGTGSTTGASTGLEPVTPASLPEPETFTAIRNLLYALEWWVFGGFAAFLWWRWCGDEVKRVSTGSTTGSESAQGAGVPSSP